MIRLFRVARSAMLAAGLCGCSLVQQGVDRELRYPGGLGGSLYDKYYVVNAAASKDLQLYRAAVTIAMLSRVATANIRDGKEADSFISLLQSSTNELNYTAAHLYRPGGSGSTDRCALTVSGHDDDCFPAMFESDLPNLERSIFNLAFAGLPKEDAVRLWQAAKSANVISAIWSTLSLVAHSLDSAHRAAAVHRANVELFALAAAQRTTATADDTASLRTVTDALCYLGFEDPSGLPCNGNPFISEGVRTAGVKTAVGKRVYLDKLREITITRDFYVPVFKMIQISCRMLPVSANDQQGDPLEKRRTDCKELKFDPQSRLTDPPAKVIAAPPTLVVPASAPPSVVAQPLAPVSTSTDAVPPTGG